MIPSLLQVDLEALTSVQLKAYVCLFFEIILGSCFLVYEVDSSSLFLRPPRAYR